MTSASKSKAQRRAESQQRAAERRAAELRAKRMRMTIRVGGGLVILAAVIGGVIYFSKGSGTPSIPPTVKHPKVATVAIPASMHLTPAPLGTPGPEAAPIPKGAKLASLANDATGQSIDGVQCQDGEQTVTHVHTHLTIFVDGKAQVIPYGIGIPGFQAVQTAEGPFVETGSCFYWLHVHANDGIIHIESPSTTLSFTLGQFFAEWGQPLSRTQVATATGAVTAFFNGRLYTGNLSDLPLGDHYQIQLDVGTPLVAPFKMTTADWGEL
jgi:hypothetical protein